MRHATRGKAKRFVAWLGTLAVVTTVGIASLSIATSAPAAAHTGDLQAAAACDAETGTYKVTYTLSLRNVPGGQTGSTKWHVGGSSRTLLIRLALNRNMRQTLFEPLWQPPGTLA